ncbi:MAG: AAC(3) family N-acetyltransferase [Planctomycetes bacterium]|nr:AAC(3) family N-acetyltransferase [Planctomycetota bacterium]
MAQTMVTREDIERGLAGLGIDGGVEVHSSLSAFGRVEGGADAVVDVLLSSFPLVMVPAFTWGTLAAAPDGVRIERNGRKPGGRRRHYQHEWTPIAFHKDMPAAKSMGVIAETLRRRPGALRSTHPTHSFAAVGADAEEVLATAGPDRPLAPIEALVERGGWILMLGTRLTSCTALHASEHLAGRNFFIRYSVDESGNLFRIRAPGCSRGFENFDAVLDTIKREVQIGDARVRAYPGSEFFRLSVEAIKRDPRITVCSPECVSCADMLAGGPVERGTAGDNDR